MIENQRNEFINPLDEYTPIPFWFWNDDLDKNEIIRQINDFSNKGVNAFVIHPRIGIPKKIEYLSDKFMGFVRSAIEEAEKLDMKVVLYDEAMYPSGSAHGMVVKNNPEYASRGLKMLEYKCHNETIVEFHEKDGEMLVSALAIKKVEGNKFDSSQIKKIICKHNKVSFVPPSLDDWYIIIFVETYTKGTIRGIHFGEDDGELESPASSDLLNPYAVQSFISLTHERYYKEFGEYFGNVITGVFTDEPDIMGRGNHGNMIAWTRGFLEFYIRQGGREEDLPALWLEGTTESINIRTRYNRAINKKLELSYYKPISEWCETHNIELTGHPHESDDIGLLKYFQVPAQDIVWRWVAPEDNKAIQGENTTMAKCTSDSARHRGKRKNGNECFACCGANKIEWSFAVDDMKWFMDWLFVRGVNLLYPHAFFYSIRGKRRIGERPPDVGPNNIWWPYYNQISQYMKRMSFIMTDSYNVTDIAVLCENHNLPWKSVKPLYENSIEFNYLERELLVCDLCDISDGAVYIQKQKYKVIIIEDVSSVTEEIIKPLEKFSQSGGTIIINNAMGYNIKIKDTIVIKEAIEILNVLDGLNSRDLFTKHNQKSLRVSHVVKDGVHYYVLVNEGEENIKDILNIKNIGYVEKWDAWKGKIRKQEVLETNGDYIKISIEINRRESVIFVLDTSKVPTFGDKKEKLSNCYTMDIKSDWKVYDQKNKLVKEGKLTPWNEWEGFKNYSGTMIYSNQFTIENREEINEIQLELEEAHEIVKVFINEKEVEIKMWAPYIFDILDYVSSGLNTLTIEVTNSLANKICNVKLKSGIGGSVKLRINSFSSC
ncbi:hypothetical protein LL037_07220 [Clostridium estertheticum]|uniref:glycosyl hydrolase n=1 Tax=Clostridium estertheticum TaxID=238834 RepID=UPI00209B0498|nr:glycosyl hydrolase [Clostridium estertheticum]WAG66913.1 hypothetical protein LL037_07220 [Clostridium estertheticum]